MTRGRLLRFQTQEPSPCFLVQQDFFFSIMNNTLIEIGGLLCHYQIQIYTFESHFQHHRHHRLLQLRGSALNKLILKTD